MATLPDHRFRNRLAHESGSSSAAYAGIIVVVVIMVAALIVASPQWGQTLTCKIGSELSKIGGGGGYSCQAEDTSHVPTQACVNGSHKTSASGTVGGTFVVKVAAEANGSILVETMSDGTYRVTDTRGGSIQVKKSVGGGSRVIIDGKSYGLQASASAGGGVTASGGVTYTVSSEQEKNDLVSYLDRHAVGDAVSTAGGPVVGIGEWIVNGTWDVFDGYDPPRPTEAYIEGGFIGSASAGATGLTTSATASAKGTSVLGTRINTETGAVTTYYKVDANAKAGVSDGVMTQGNGNVQGAMTIAVTVGADGNTTNVTATGMYYASAGSSAQAGPFGETIGAVSVDTGRRYQASVDLTSQETTSISQDMLRSFGIPVPNQDGSVPATGPTAAGEAAETFVNAARDRGVLTRQDVDVSGHEYGFDAGLDLGVGLSLGGRYSTEDVSYSNGQYWDGHRWQTWEGC